jgi:hypothetical protein
MFHGTEIIFVSASASLLEAARAEGLHVINPAVEQAIPAEQAEAV